GSTAHQPTGTPSWYATRPEVVAAPGWPQFVWMRSRKARSSTGKEPNDSFGASLKRWHWHLAAWPRVPNTPWRSSQVASLAGTLASAWLMLARRLLPPPRLPDPPRT